MSVIEILMARLVGYILHHTFGNLNENSLLHSILVAEEKLFGLLKSLKPIWLVARKFI